jgi:hypothetical protein
MLFLFLIKQGGFYCSTLLNTASSAAPQILDVGGRWDRTQNSCDYAALSVRCSNHSAKSQPHSSKSHPQNRLNLIHSRLNLIHTRLNPIHTRLNLIHHSANSHPRSARSHPPIRLNLIHNSAKSHPQTRLNLIHIRLNLIHTRLNLGLNLCYLCSPTNTFSIILSLEVLVHIVEWHLPLG